MQPVVDLRQTRVFDDAGGFQAAEDLGGRRPARDVHDDLLGRARRARGVLQTVVEERRDREESEDGRETDVLGQDWDKAWAKARFR